MPDTPQGTTEPLTTRYPHTYYILVLRVLQDLFFLQQFNLLSRDLLVQVSLQFPGIPSSEDPPELRSSKFAFIPSWPRASLVIRSCISCHSFMYLITLRSSWHSSSFCCTSHRRLFHVCYQRRPLSLFHCDKSSAAFMITRTPGQDSNDTDRTQCVLLHARPSSRDSLAASKAVSTSRLTKNVV